MRVIAAKATPPYETRVAAAIIRLLALFALILMPVGMGLSPAAASGHELPAASAAMSEHCGGDQEPSEPGKADRAMHCAAACTALPAHPSAEAVPVAFDGAVRSLLVEQHLSGGEPEIATPPPKA
jgi:hypothetical protein